MPEPSLEAQPLCASADLVERGDAVLFDVVEFGRTVQAFALRFDDVAVAYLNRCAHVPAEMDWQPGKFWDMDQRFIICSVHGALYDPPQGLCVGGPCVGARLQAIQLREEGGHVYWYPSERFQPASNPSSDLTEPAHEHR
ncbi:MAG: Rieske 2Fe-2S domain-containing protein [Proteobacteria bacterium]|uniref:Rieske (2Fe-2S) protein n=1 Tax=Aquabacterium sp. TaxID=1872578 RepID=UPI0035C6DAB5|nr:Rieske 2Fe-2S domain-containing protein [Pseudomonadota bacterium]